jgi:hypothetical protein
VADVVDQVVPPNLNLIPIWYPSLNY